MELFRNKTLKNKIFPEIQIETLNLPIYPLSIYLRHHHLGTYLCIYPVYLYVVYVHVMMMGI